MAKVLEQKPWLGMRLVGIFDDRGADRRHAIDRVDCQVLGGFDDLLRCAREGAIDIVYVALPMRAENRYSLLFRALTDTTVTVYLIADFFAYAMLRARWGEVGGIPVVSIHDTPFQGVVGWLKRMEDLVVGSAHLGSQRGAHAGHRASRQAIIKGTGVLPPAPLWIERQADPCPQVQDHDGLRGRPLHQAGRGERPTDHTDRALCCVVGLSMSCPNSCKS